ncbi:MAG: hypothetical protein ACO1NN_10330 [Sphingopyxis sp.]
MTEAFDRATRRIISRSRQAAGLLPIINASSAACSLCPTDILVSIAPPARRSSMASEIDETGKQKLIEARLTHSKYSTIAIMKVSVSVSR